VPPAFHPAVARWFTDAFAQPTAVQEAGWARIATGGDTLIAAPTGSGKTLAAFLWAIDRLVTAGTTGGLDDRIDVLYISPLKALGNDIEKNLRDPLHGIRHAAFALGHLLPEIRVAVRTGDTPARDRQLLVRRPPHILITTPESLYILLTAEKSRAAIRQASTVIIDEIHAVAGDKRGAHLALSLERLDELVGRPLQRIGLSATQRPVEEIARLLVGAGRCDAGGVPRCAIVDLGHRREIDLRVEVPPSELGPITSHVLRAEVYDRLATLVRAHRTTIVFVNTRRLVERIAHALSERLGAAQVAAHHGSLARHIRLAAEEGLKTGAISVIVATASLELGIDVGHVDLVCHLGAPRALASLLQRVGRSGHFLGAIPKGILFPLTRDDLVQAAAAVRAVYAGELDRLRVPENPLDILAQQMVATIAGSEMSVDALWRLVRRAHPFRRLRRADFDAVLEMLAEGVATRRGRRSAYLHFDRVHERLRARRGARLAAITGGGAIPDTADYDVVEEPADVVVGKVNEDFAVESLAGDIFLLGNRSWRIRRVETGRVRVVDANGAPPTIPFWLGEAPARTAELSAAVATLRFEVAERRHDRGAAVAWVVAEARVDEWAAEQIVTYVDDTVRALGAVPTLDAIVAERFFDEAGGMQLVLHAPFGGRINRAFGLLLRKRFCVSFDFELQAAATDDGIVLSLGEQHSFPLDGVFSMVRPRGIEADLVQAALAAPMFTNRWRWNVTRALAVLRHNGGRRVPMPIQRMRAEDLLAAVFPGQVACGDNHAGPIEPPDHPLVTETLDNCLYEAMDVEGLARVLGAIEAGTIRTVAVDTPAPSPMSHEILNANPYAFLDDAPLEERRARAVSLRRVIPDLAGGIGALDPQAIAEVRAQAWPAPRDADETHDALLTLGLLPASDAAAWASHVETLIAAERAARVARPGDDGAVVAAERAEDVRSICPEATFTPPVVGLRRRQARAPARRYDPGRSRYDDASGASAIDASGGAIAPRQATHPSEPVSGASSVRRSVGVGMGVDVMAGGTGGGASEPANASTSDARAPDVPTAGACESQGATLRSFAADAIDPEAALVDIVGGWMSCLGPTTAAALAARLGLAPAGVAGALARLEGDGVVLRGRFTDAAGDQEEWCERGLLARIHRLTLGRLRREIEPVAVADFLRALFRWQHVHDGAHLHGRDGVRAVIAQLQGLELPGPAWERDVLPSRVASYDPADLEHLCLAGEVAWGRLAVARPAEDDPEASSAPRRRAAPTRAAPLAFVLREDLPELLEPNPPARAWRDEMTPIARDVLLHLERRGASFLADIARAIRRLPTEVEAALWELVASGLVTGDGIAGLRTLLLPEEKRHGRRARARGAAHLRPLPGRGARRLMPVGRWALLRPDEIETSGEPTAAAERCVRRLLARYGVVFREICARERRLPAWRFLLGALRRLEARGEVRGGRFVAGFVGEQFALPEAVEALRAVRRRREGDETVVIAAADPLNLVGILTPGARVSPFSGQVIAFRNGVPVEIGELGTVLSRLQTVGASGAVI
jgi:ATP-dependent Lhr-like helicase